MTAFFMHYCKKIKQHLLASLLACLFAMFTTTAIANNSGLSIQNAGLELVEDSYMLNADVDIKIGEEMEQAIVKGFVLNFIVEFQLVVPRKYWFDDEIVTVTRRISLSYHALSRQYLIIRGDQQKTFASLDDAIDDLSHIRDLKVLQKSDVEKSKAYKAALLMRLDQTKLPKALQVDAVGADDWKMVSQRFEWTPSLIK